MKDGNGKRKLDFAGDDFDFSSWVAMKNGSMFNPQNKKTDLPLTCSAAYHNLGSISFGLNDLGEPIIDYAKDGITKGGSTGWHRVAPCARLKEETRFWWNTDIGKWVLTNDSTRYSGLGYVSLEMTTFK